MPLLFSDCLKGWNNDPRHKAHHLAAIITEPTVLPPPSISSVLMKVTWTSWQCTQIRGSKRMVWLMVPNKDGPQRRGNWRSSAHKSQGWWEWRWEEDKSNGEMLWGCREKQLDAPRLCCPRIPSQKICVLLGKASLRPLNLFLLICQSVPRLFWDYLCVRTAF